MNFRVGFGYDVHAMRADEPFILGGIEIPHHQGPFGHSDADILIHSICDALLGAACLGDIGRLFPDTDPQYKGIDSKILLKEVIQRIRAENYEVGNMDCTVCLQLPKLKPHIEAMQKSLSAVMNVPTNNISIKATTTERLGFVGREEGVSVYVVVLIYKV